MQLLLRHARDARQHVHAALTREYAARAGRCTYISYRNDHDATLARNHALQSEADRLRSELARAQAERDALRDVLETRSSVPIRLAPPRPFGERDEPPPSICEPGDPWSAGDYVGAFVVALIGIALVVMPIVCAQG